VCWVNDERLHLKGSHRAYPNSRVKRAMLSGNRPPIHSPSLLMRQWAPEPRRREARPVCPSETRLRFSTRRVFSRWDAPKQAGYVLYMLCSIRTQFQKVSGRGGQSNGHYSVRAARVRPGRPGGLVQERKGRLKGGQT
jgi:hypothetical protein